jgi:hypothetical protein
MLVGKRTRNLEWGGARKKKKKEVGSNAFIPGRGSIDGESWGVCAKRKEVPIKEGICGSASA